MTTTTKHHETVAHRPVHAVKEPEPPPPPKKAEPVAVQYEIPDWFVNRYSADLQELVAKAKASHKTESTEFATELVGTGARAAVTVLSDGKRVWSPHNAEIESWFKGR